MLTDPGGDYRQVRRRCRSVESGESGVDFPQLRFTLRHRVRQRRQADTVLNRLDQVGELLGNLIPTSSKGIPPNWRLVQRLRDLGGDGVGDHRHDLRPEELVPERAKDQRVDDLRQDRHAVIASHQAGVPRVAAAISGTAVSAGDG